jgi:acetoin utilization deacetylase AcuC-like enzyme
MLEGGYDLNALRMSTASTLAAMLGEHHSEEKPTSGGSSESFEQLTAIESYWK